MKRIAVDDLPPEPLAAAGLFHQHWLAHIAAALDGFEVYLGNAPGITGQYFESDGTGAGDPLVEPS